MNPEMIPTSFAKIATYSSTGNGLPVVFIHGNSLSGITFIKQFESELAGKYRFIAFDLPGHGASEKPGDAEACYSVAGYIKVIQDVIHHYNLDKYVIVGHSMGGNIAMEASPDLPGLLGMMTFGAPPIGLPPAFERMYLPNPAMGLNLKGELSSDEIQVLAHSWADENSIREKIIDLLNQSDPAGRSYLAASLGQGKYRDEVEIVKNYDKSIAILNGEKDPWVNVNYYNEIDIPNLWRGEVQVVSGGSHSLQLEQPESFNGLLHDLLEEIER